MYVGRGGISIENTYSYGNRIVRGGVGTCYRWLGALGGKGGGRMGEEVIDEGEGDVGGVGGRGEVETYGIALIQCVRSRKRRQLRVMIRPRLSVGARYQIRVTMYQLEAGDLPQRPRALYIAAAPAMNIHE